MSQGACVFATFLPPIPCSFCRNPTGFGRPCFIILQVTALQLTLSLNEESSASHFLPSTRNPPLSQLYWHGIHLKEEVAKIRIFYPHNIPESNIKKVPDSNFHHPICKMFKKFNNYKRKSKLRQRHRQQ